MSIIMLNNGAAITGMATGTVGGRDITETWAVTSSPFSATCRAITLMGTFRASRVRFRLYRIVSTKAARVILPMVNWNAWQRDWFGTPSIPTQTKILPNIRSFFSRKRLRGSAARGLLPLTTITTRTTAATRITR